MMKHSQILLPRPCWLQMSRQVEAEAPLEACGLLAGVGNRVEAIYPITNALKSPVRFRMDPYEQLQAFEGIEKSGLELVAIYHSHPGGPETPSLTDIAEWRYDLPCLILFPSGGEWRARAFWLDTGHAAELGLYISEM